MDWARLTHVGQLGWLIFLSAYDVGHWLLVIAATTLTSWHLMVTFCTLHVAQRMNLFEPKFIDLRTVMLFGMLNGISIGFLNLSLGFNSIGFYQVQSPINPIRPFDLIIDCIWTVSVVGPFLDQQQLSNYTFPKLLTSKLFWVHILQSQNTLAHQYHLFMIFSIL